MNINDTIASIPNMTTAPYLLPLSIYIHLNKSALPQNFTCPSLNLGLTPLDIFEPRPVSLNIPVKEA